MSKNTTPVAGEVIAIPLKNISVKSDWNVRSGDFMLTEGTELEAGFKELLDSIDERGQDTPVTVTPGKTEGKYVLRVGFRRYAAIKVLSERDKVENPTILAIVRTMTEAQAAELNVRENTDREDLRPPDIAWGVGRVRALQEKEGTFESESSLARSVGLKQAYVNKLMRIYDGVDPDIFSHWRAAKEPIGVLRMFEFAKKVPREKQKEEYEKLISAEKKKGGRKSADDKYEKARKQCINAAEFLALLYRAGHINCDELNFNKACPDLIKGEVELTSNQWKRIANDCNDVFGKITAGEDLKKEKGNQAAEAN